MNEPNPERNSPCEYQLNDRVLENKQLTSPIFDLATCQAGSILVSRAGIRLNNEPSFNGEDSDFICVTMPLLRLAAVVTDVDAATGPVPGDLVWRTEPGMRLRISDGNARRNVLFKAADVEDALKRTLGARLHEPLRVRPDVDWDHGLAASLKCQLDFVIQELQRSDGVVSNPVAFAATTDLLISLLLLGVPHNYSDQLDRIRSCAVPAYVRRAENFMRAHSAEPIRMAQIAAAAGCSVGTLGTVFRHFRGQTPLAALHAVRLEQALSELIRGEPGATVAAVAQRYGFTNAARFSVAFRRRFGETPADVIRRAPGS